MACSRGKFYVLEWSYVFMRFNVRLNTTLVVFTILSSSDSSAEFCHKLLYNICDLEHVVH